jgi:hypothetical protein
MAMSDRGLALPSELSVCFPEPPDFSADAFHNRSTHTESIHEGAAGTSARGKLIPIIHRGLSPGRRTDVGLPLASDIATLGESRGMSARDCG